jgi:vitamin B12 transporter
MISLYKMAAAQTEEEMKILGMFYKEKDLVITPTGHPKPISQVAENITVVTAKEIEEMNAHTVAEVLNRIPGLFVNFNQDFGASSLIFIQGSEPRHVLVLVDGFRWNFLADGSAETNSIPVGVIDRIEVIKGPASSTWGSSLGGVINIITRPTGMTKRPTGAVRASYGENDTQDYRGEVSGTAGSVGYYLLAGHLESDGLRDAREFDMDSLYSKLNIPVSKDANVGLSFGYSDPETKLGDFPSIDITSTGMTRTFFATASLDASLTRNVSLDVLLYHFKQDSDLTNNALGLGMVGPPGELFLNNKGDEETTGARSKLVWEKGIHTAVLGADFDRGELDQTVNAGPFLQARGVPATSSAQPDMDRWAVFANDTIVLDRWSITPGIRFDDNSITDSFLSPSLGLTYRLGMETVLRGSVSRGFTIPPLSSTSSGGLFLAPNPSLEPEEVWSYQAGVESAAAKYVWAKATLFRHDLDNALIRERFAAGPPTFNDLVINNGEVRRQGIEVEAETLPFYNFSLWAGFAYVDIKPSNETGSEEIYTYNILIRYDNEKFFTGQLFGHYIWWDADGALNASYDDFIWDLNLNKKIYAKKKTSAEIFFTAHNLFSGGQYLLGDNKNPQRWVEGGIRVKF